MASRSTTLGGFIAELMARHQHSNRSLASVAGISEGAVRNILKHGLETDAKDPDAKTLQVIANALNVHPLRLYRLAGYLPPEQDTHSVRAEFVADIFDRLSAEKQEAVLGVLDAMAGDVKVSQTVQAIRADSNNPLAGFDLHSPKLLRVMANELVAHYQMTESLDVSRIQDDAQIMQHKWADLPQSTQERIKALIRHKLSLDYDPTMVDPEWRK